MFQALLLLTPTLHNFPSPSTLNAHLLYNSLDSDIFQTVQFTIDGKLLVIDTSDILGF